MTRPQLETIPTFYKGYIERVKDMDLFDALAQSSSSTLLLLGEVPENKGEYRYTEGKWTITEMLAHLIDVERIMAYRALRFARNDKTDLPGFDENEYAVEANAQARSISQYVAEMQRLRAVTIDMFKSFSPEMLFREGKANKNKVSVINLGYIIAGHESHHRAILQERYLQA